MACGGKTRKLSPALVSLRSPFSSSASFSIAISTGSGSLLSLVTVTWDRPAPPVEVISTWIGVTDMAAASRRAEEYERAGE